MVELAGGEERARRDGGGTGRAGDATNLEFTRQPSGLQDASGSNEQCNAFESQTPPFSAVQSEKHKQINSPA